MNTNEQSVSRRKLLQLAGIGASLTTMPGCWWTKGLSCKLPPPLDSAPLLIDAHCHIFNGTDIQAKEFLSRVATHLHGVAQDAVDTAANALQDLAWSEAPTGKEELAMLAKVCGGQIFDKKHREKHRQASYARARNALQRTQALKDYNSRRQQMKGRVPVAPPPPPPNGRLSREEVLQRINDAIQSPSFEEYKLKQAPAPPPAPAARVAPPPPGPQAPSASAAHTVDGALKYIIQNFQYRYIMIHDYLDTFFRDNNNIDLIVASLVDYDWWLAKGGETATKLDDQIAVMERICVLRRGQVHGMAPFDPLKEVAFRAGKPNSRISSLSLVQDAVEKHGFLGVKIYPPMGFAPLGNAANHAAFWTGDWLPDWIRTPIQYASGSEEIGARLDEVLSEFYDWCCAKDVPVLAHSAQSVGVAPDFEKLAGAAHWRTALEVEKFRKLRINFGHFGDFGDTLDKDQSPEVDAFMALMGDQGAIGEHAYADTAYFNEVLAQQSAVTDRLKKLYGRTPVAGQAPLAHRLMYGTDWNLLINAGDIQSYYDDFVAVFKDIDAVWQSDPYSASQRFFGHNAADWLGLENGQTRERLEAFYKAHGIDTAGNPPSWMAKLRRS